MERPVELARPWAGGLVAAARHLRLNRSFVDHRQWQDHLLACVDDELRVDTDSGLPTARAWARARVEAESAEHVLSELARIDASRLGEAQQTRHSRRIERLRRLGACTLLPGQRVDIALRGWVRPGRASWRVVVDRLDPSNGEASRTMVVLEDEPGERLGPQDLETHASAAFSSLMLALATHDAAFVWAALEEQPGLEVREVVRGVIGPAFFVWADGVRTGPAVLEQAGIEGPLLCALSERVGPDVASERVDEPLDTSLTVPAPGSGARLARHRKWSLPRMQVSRLRAWLASRDSKGLIYAV